MSSESATNRPVLCPDCSSGNSYFDRYCGVCGAALARLRWRVPGGEWQSGDGRVAINQGVRAASISFSNDGVVPAALILDQQEIERLPAWVDGENLQEQVIQVPPGSEQSLDVPLVGRLLEQLFRPEGQEDAAGEELALEARLPLLTNLTEYRDGQWTCRPFTLSLRVARQPWLAPAASLYRFIPLERLAGDGLEHAIEIHNEAAASVELTDFAVEEDPALPPEGYDRLAVADLFDSGFRVPQTLEAGAPWVHRLKLRADSSALSEDVMGWFSATVRYQLLYNQESHWVESRLCGVVGRGPSLEIEPEALDVTSPDPDDPLRIEVRNPGQLPVLVRAIEVLRQKDERAPAVDWLRLAGLEAGELIAPGESRELSVRIDPGERPRDEFDLDQGERRIVLHHDGWQDEGARQAVCEVCVSFEPVAEGTIGVDFGTSNSVVCLMGEETGHPLILEILEDGRRLDYLASLMYYDESMATDEQDEGFLFGEAAKGTARLEPANLVRSIKTVVVSGTRMRYRFFAKDGDRRRRVAKEPQDLLNLFIRKLRIQGEKHLAFLPADARSEAGLDSHLLTFRHAVFSHPVQVPKNMKRALMQAAHEAQVNTLVEDPDQFFSEFCVDEATAAVLAYVDSRLAGDLMADASLLDFERVLCFDMGGGTTDIAAVEVLDAKAYGSGDKAHVTVRLWSKAGDNGFGGDYLDRRLARMLLEQVRQKSERQAAPIMIEDLELAIQAPSFTSFQGTYGQRLKHDPRRQGVDVDAQARAVYRLADDILNQAETAKRSFSDQSEVTSSLPGSGWPRAHAAEEVSADNYDVVLKREDFETLVEAELKQRFRLLDSVVEAAGWDWPSVTTLLFTGQSVRSPSIRRPIIEHVEKSRGAETAESLILIEPGNGAAGGFDPKLCVAIGAAIWGLSRKSHPYLKIERPLLERLSFDLTLKAGRKYVKIEGLESGMPLPATGDVETPMPTTELILYQNRSKFATFNYPKPATQVTVRVEGPADLWVLVDGQEIKGKVIT